MSFELSVILILIILLVYIVMINIFSILLRISGVPASIANFQGISLFTNCGYTTSESETIAVNKLRRRIAIICMITGNFFSVIIVSLIVNIFNTFSLSDVEHTYHIALIAVAVFAVFMIITQLPPVKKVTSGLIQKIVDNRIQKNNQDNAITIVETFGGSAIVEIHVHWIPEILYGKTIHESKLKANYNINILSLQRNKKHVEIARNTLVQKGDRLLVYGQYAVVREVFSNSAEKAEIAAKINRELVSQFNELELIDNFGHGAMVEVRVNMVPAVLEEKTLFESRLKEKFGINVMFIERGEDAIEINKDTKVEEGDILMVFGPFQAIKNVFVY